MKNTVITENFNKLLEVGVWAFVVLGMPGIRLEKFKNKTYPAIGGF